MAVSGGRGEWVAAANAPIARVCVDVPLPHLDRPFDYLVPTRFDAEAVPGARVRVRFAGQLVDGYLLSRAEGSEHTGRLSWLDKVVSPEPVLSPEIAKLCRAVADRYAGTLIDVLRLAVPPRHARVEKEPPPAPPPAPPTPPTTGWDDYFRGRAFVDAVAEGRGANAVWQAAPGEDWPRRLAEIAATAAAGGRGAVLVLPDHRDVRRVAAACVELIGAEGVVALTADLGPARRYRRWLAASRGLARVVVGTRSSAFAPVRDLGVAVVWDDGDDVHADQRSPYPHAREVLMLRTHAAGAAMVISGFARTAQAHALVESGWAHEIVTPRQRLRVLSPRMTAIGEHDSQLARDPAARSARLPSVAFEAAREALAAAAPVLVQVPRSGYVPALACGNCREPARCRHCAGPLALPRRAATADHARSASSPTCGWCGKAEAGFRCAACGSARLRAVVVGADRTAEELGRAFPGVTVRVSGGGEVLDSVPAKPALVVATVGAEPIVEGGYGAALLLDGWALLGRPDLRAAEEALRRWLSAAALVRRRDDGGRVVVMAESALAPVQALIRWDPAWHADVELTARTELSFPPAVRMATVDGTSEAVAAFLDELRLPDQAEVLGPVPVPGRDETLERILIRVPRAHGRPLAAALADARAVRGARRERDPVRVRLDPLDLL